IGSTTLRVKRAATAASIALPPAASISAPAADASGWLVTTMPRVPIAGRFSQLNVVWARDRQSVLGICVPLLCIYRASALRLEGHGVPWRERGAAARTNDHR